MQVLIPAALHTYTRQPRVEATGATLSELFDDLERRYPGLRFRIIDEQNQLRPNMRLFVNRLGVRDLGHALAPQDSVAVVLALSGG
jgi:molybdopterin converting factor small subunit